MGVQLYSSWISAAVQTFCSTSKAVSPSVKETCVLGRINHLYEFDCGKESGWMYKVNGWFPNYGCSACKVENGDDIVWCYTCKGFGKDVGGGWMTEGTAK